MIDLVRGSIRKIYETVEGASRFNAYRFRIGDLHVRPQFNAAREADPAHLDYVDELAQAIAANGFKQSRPLVVAPGADGRMYVSDGHTRLAAAKLANEKYGAKIEFLPCVDEGEGVSEDDRIAGLIVHNNGRPLTALGQASVLKQLMGRGHPVEVAARMTGMSVAKARDLLTLAGAPVEVRDMVASGRVSSTLAIQTMKDDGQQAVTILKDADTKARAAGKKKVTKRDVKGKVKRSKMVTVAMVRERLDAGCHLTDEQIAAVLQAASTYA